MISTDAIILVKTWSVSVKHQCTPVYLSRCNCTCAHTVRVYVHTLYICTYSTCVSAYIVHMYLQNMRMCILVYMDINLHQLKCNSCFCLYYRVEVNNSVFQRAYIDAECLSWISCVLMKYECSVHLQFVTYNSITTRINSQ